MAGSSFDTGSFAVPDRVPRLALDPRHRRQPDVRRRERSEAVIALALVAVVAVAIVATTTGHASLGAARAAVRTRATQHAAAAIGGRARPVTLNWVGDIALSSERGLPPAGVAASLAPVASTLRSGDGTIGNLEGTLSAGGGSKCGSTDGGGTCFAFQAPPPVAGALRSVGFKLVNQANNHSLDFGEAGRTQTQAALRHYGLPYTGLPGQITTISLHGTRVAFVGFAPYRYTASLLDIPAAEALVRAARRQARLVVVIIHAGAEGSTATHVPDGDETFLGEDRGNARAFAHGVIDAGAAAVIGSGPHVVRGIEDYRGHLIAYSTGNFVGYNTLGHGGVLSAAGILHFTLAPNGRLRAGRWVSVALVDGLPRIDGSNSVAQFVSELSAEDFPSDHFTFSADGRFHG